MSLSLALFLAAAASAHAPTLSAGPERILVEEWPQRRDLNFEIYVDNAGGPARELVAMEVFAYDDAGQLRLRRRLDGNGVRPSIRTVPERELPAGGKLTVINPFASFAHTQALAKLRYQLSFAEAGGEQEVEASLEVRPQSARGAQPLQLPLRGPVWNYDGHDLHAHHRRFDTSFAPLVALGFRGNFMRYAYDFVPLDAQGREHHGNPARNEDWSGFGAEVLAIADGTVVLTESSRPDDRKFDESRLAQDLWVLFGNYVVIDHGHGEFGVYAHLQQGSVLPAVGARVRSGETIGRVGASGSAMFPHLHFQLQAAPDLKAEGLPSYFETLRDWPARAGDQPTSRSVDSGEIVSAD